MLCKNPFRPMKGVEYGCGQCLCCRINKRREWTARLVLEASSHRAASAFVTCTYAPEWLPDGATLVPAHAEEFRYRLRYALGFGFRYYYVGEYGERGGRPHYHWLLFGLQPYASVFERIWEKGSIHVGEFSVDSAAYCAGYVTKKWTDKEHKDLHGRHPEFARMSRRPGIGVHGLQSIIGWLYSSEGAAYLQRMRDVPQTVRFNGGIFPLGRHLVSQLRLEFNIDVSDRDEVRARRKYFERLDQALPELAELREFRREGHFRKAKFYARLKREKGKI